MEFIGNIILPDGILYGGKQNETDRDGFGRPFFVEYRENKT